MFNWDLNSLVDSAASLVTDAQNDLASWEKRDDEATQEAPAPEAEGEDHLSPCGFLLNVPSALVLGTEHPSVTCRSGAGRVVI